MCLQHHLLRGDSYLWRDPRHHLVEQGMGKTYLACVAPWQCIETPPLNRSLPYIAHIECELFSHSLDLVYQVNPPSGSYKFEDTWDWADFYHAGTSRGTSGLALRQVELLAWIAGVAYGGV